MLLPVREELPGPLIPAAPSRATVFTDPERLPSPARPALPAFARHCPAIPPTSAICSIHEHNLGSPPAPIREGPDRAIVLADAALAEHQLGWGSAFAVPATGQDQIRLSPHRHRPPRRIGTDGITPTPFGSDTSCRALGDWLTGEASLSGCFRTCSEPTAGGSAFAKPATAERPACAGRPAFRTASRVPPRRGSRAAAPEVSSIVESASRRLAPGSASRARFRPPGGWTLVHRLFPTCGEASAPFSSRLASCSDGADAREDSDTGNQSAREPIRLTSVRSAPRTSA